MPSSERRAQVAKLFGIDARPEEPIPTISHADPYAEDDPSVSEWAEQFIPSFDDISNYFVNLLPFTRWITKYNLSWFVGDLVAGLTVGCIVVPQAMAYAQLAQLPVEYGLYSSFMGVAVYWFFATSKDITIGPVAVMSQVTGNVVSKAATELPGVEGHVIASALAVITGGIITAMGLIRIGWIVEFIPLPAICAFMTGSAVSIAAGQLCKLMGISGVDTHQGVHLVIIDTLKEFPNSTIDSALGISALVFLYIIREGAAYMAKKQPNRAKIYFFISTLRTSFVILLYTAISAACNVHRRENPMFDIVGSVPSGFRHAKVPEITSDMFKAFGSELPAAVIVMLIEHIAISKSFGRINNYVIDPSQELVAIGVTNLLGPFLGAYPATGSFSRTAVKSKAGVRTPFAGVLTAVVVLLALYALTAVFFYIPNAALAGVIIHAVCDVITPPRTVYQFWRVAPHEVPIFFAGVFVTVFTTIENGVYTTIAASFAVLIFRLFLSQGRFLGRTRIRTVGRPSAAAARSASSEGDLPSKSAHISSKAMSESGGDVYFDDDGVEMSLRPGFLPVEHEDGSNSEIVVENPYPGVFVYRFSEGFNYPNASRYLGHLTDVIFKSTRRTDPSRLGKLGDRPWNEAGTVHKEKAEDESRPTLKAVVLDFSAVNNIDVTSVQALTDTRTQLDRYTAPDTVDWHFANITNRWTKRGLVAAGFGLRKADDDRGEAIFSIAELMGSRPTPDASKADLPDKRHSDIESEGESAEPLTAETRKVVIHGLNRPHFHFDLHEAVEAAVADARTKIF
ncbi:solute carrier family 26 (sodium-independent sulfate anion transporter), member 11 [Geosmithia morbida]|uniref:Solute carrier family 26 (Sodium-independent sulfate anion transporter), member 11 n=1 Tax=Geosmithia morbida TaxID=1094350 RepID=A0A9P5CZC5_9HYPO|nr:solute carrier family 26 (sodium-independent sulfate anion transporter), member 11 [Geosmithia morbida]KAF4121428.1 solute carrier family 26 (sodium-independent sulfate anion transporter), member 11 [Geosmithia morbida]